MTRYSFSSVQGQEINSYAANLARLSKELQRILEEGEYGACITSPVAACAEFSSFRPAMQYSAQRAGMCAYTVRPPLLKCMCDSYLPLCANRRLALFMQAYGVRLSSMWPRTEAPLCSAAVSSRHTGRQTLLV